jgi:hypothetical protein
MRSGPFHNKEMGHRYSPVFGPYLNWEECEKIMTAVTAKKTVARKTAASKGTNSVPLDVVAGSDDATAYEPGTALSEGFQSDGSVSLERDAYSGTIESEHAFGRALLNLSQFTEVPVMVQRTDSDGTPMIDRFSNPVMVPNGTAAYYRRQLDAMVASI